ncbi:Rap1a/Tai family immunity protein [Massilia horti]|uniref:Rap1a immunity protein domain-containing protein n=1 Tax=Massilia horti TaxID=2562153 RepID=A0A4Y9SX34_9BURK|nr:Rap1a/Tai family immunity protein [Massilia horti]TFW31019.1 hypothetical protein E4O92_15040 [Massilia horti]
MRGLILLGLAVAVPCFAQPAWDGPWMTGERLLKMVTFRPDVKNNFDLTPEEYLESERARAYINGVHDTTEGRGWCYSQRYHPGPEALLDDVLVGLRKLPPQQLKRNAGDLIVEIWGRKWPCADRRKQR